MSENILPYIVCQIQSVHVSKTELRKGPFFVGEIDIGMLLFSSLWIFLFFLYVFGVGSKI